MTRATWEPVRLRFLFDEIDQRVGSPETDLPLLSVSIHRGVTLRSESTDREARADDFVNYKRVEPGNVVINRMRAFEGGAGVSAFQGIVSSDYAVIRAKEMLEPRFLHHLIRSRWFVGEMTARLRGIGNAELGNVRTPRINIEDLGNILVPLPSVVEQRAIADYLDEETARIDRLVSARTRQLALIGEHLEVEAETLIHMTHAPVVALRRVVDLLPGFSYRSEDFLTGPARARLLRGINVGVGSLRWDDAVWIDDRVATTTSRFALVAGDIVMGMDRPVISSGIRIARATEADLPAFLVQRVARLRARTGLSQEYLYAAIRSPRLAGHFAPVFTGVSVPHVSPSQILSYEIPLPPAAQQGEVVRALVKLEDYARDYQAAARRQIDLLQERRQALITAAVSGQLDIPGVAA